jgi:hypothetical protein
MPLANHLPATLVLFSFTVYSSPDVIATCPQISWDRKCVSGTEILDIAEYDLEIYEENPEDHEHHGANWIPGAKKIEGTIVGELPIRKALRLVTEEGYSLSFYLRDSFGSVVSLHPMLDSTGNHVH